MGACLATRPDHISLPRRVSPEFVPPRTSLDHTNVYQATPSSPQKVEVIYTDDTRKKLSLDAKLRGNEHFSKKEYLLAADSYTKAIKIYDNNPVFFSNRALCYAFLARYEEALADAEMSIELDPKNYKPYHVKGITLVEIGKREESTQKMKEGLEWLQKSLEMVKESQSGKRAISQLEAKVNRANKIIYLKEHGEQLQKQNETKLFIEQLISKDKTQSEEQKKMTKDLVSTFINEREDHRVQDIPETLTCKITFDLIIEPVISSSGISYEKEALMGHLNKVGFFDPSTRQPVNPNKLLPNNQLLDSIKDFQTKNPWSFEFISPNEDYHTISMQS